MIIYDDDKPNARERKARSRSPRRRVNKRSFWFGIAGLLVVVALTTGGLAAKSYLAKKASDNPTQAREEVKISQTYLSSADQSSGSSVAVSLTAPGSWKVKSDNGASVKVLDAGDFVAAHFGFKPDAPGGSADGDIILENIQSWLSVQGTADSYGGLTSKAQKSAFISQLQSFKQKQSVSQSDSKNLIQLSAQVGGFQNLTYVGSSDDQLAGVIYETVVSQNGGYQPVIVTYLTGTVKNEPIYLRGIVTYQDNAWGDLYGNGGNPTPDQIKQAVSDFAGGKVDTGMTELASHFSDLLKTLKIQ